MKVHVLFAQRKERYLGECAPKCLAVMSEQENYDNPDFLPRKKLEFDRTNEFERTEIIGLDVSTDVVMSRLRPHAIVLPAAVLPAVSTSSERQTTLSIEGQTNSQYRVRPVDGGFEAQIHWPHNVPDDVSWHSLNPLGYWSDTSRARKRDVYATEEQAAEVIRKARAINESVDAQFPVEGLTT